MKLDLEWHLKQIKRLPFSCQSSRQFLQSLVLANYRLSIALLPALPYKLYLLESEIHVMHDDHADGDEFHQ